MKKLTLIGASLAIFAGCAPKKPVAAFDRATGASEEGERAGRRNADQARIDPANVRVYVPEPTGKNKKPGCQGTCQVTNPEVLTPAAADIMLAKVVAMPVGTDSLELDTLLFHDHETQHRLDEKSTPMSAEWESFLRKELTRKDVLVTIRVVDDKGAERAFVEETWTIGQKGHHMVHDVQGVPPFEASGTLVRVGREHLWVRM